MLPILGLWDVLVLRRAGGCYVRRPVPTVGVMMYFFGPGRDTCGDCFINPHGAPVCTMNCSGRTCQTTTSSNIGRGVGVVPAPTVGSSATTPTVSRTLLEIAFDLSQIKRHNQNYLADSRYVTINVPRKLMEEMDKIVRRYSDHLPLPEVGDKPRQDRGDNPTDSTQHQE